MSDFIFWWLMCGLASLPIWCIWWAACDLVNYPEDPRTIFEEEWKEQSVLAVFYIIGGPLAFGLALWGCIVVGATFKR